MKNLMILCMSLMSIHSANAQQFHPMAGEFLTNASTMQLTPRTSDEEPLPLYVLQGAYPEFPGGETEMIRYIQEHVEFPELARFHGHEGTVVIQYVIDANGNIDQPKVVKGIGLGCDEAALAVFKNMPRWKPAVQGGKTIAVKYVTPVKFRLH